MGGCSSQLEAAVKVNSSVNITGRNAICFGATAGIGEAVALKLATKGCNVTIVGRNEESGKRILNVMERTYPQGKHAFVKSDLVLLKNCKKVADDYVKSHERLDYVVYCQTKATMQGRTPTPTEGIDEKLCLNYYSRVYLTNLLLPLLRKTAESDPQSDPRTLSVLAAGQHPGYALWKSDTRLEKPENYGMKNAADLGVFYNDLTFDKFAKLDENKGKVTFIHSCPGFVDTNWGSDMNVAVKGLIRVMQATAGRKPSECAEFMCRALLEPSYKNKAEKPGVVLVGQYGINDAEKTVHHTDEAIDHVWKDTNELLNEVEKKF